jgi:hypothetical protein
MPKKKNVYRSHLNKEYKAKKLFKGLSIPEKSEK